MIKILFHIIVIGISLIFAQNHLTDEQKNLNERAGSSEWQPDRIMDTLNIQQGWYIGDLGAGGGYYSYRFAQETGPHGKVFSADINSDFLKGIAQEAREKRLKNIETVLCSIDDSEFEEKSLDLIFIRNTFHHLENRNQYMKKLASKLKQDGHIVIIDYKKDFGRFFNHSVDREDILSALKNSGLIIEKEFDFIDKQYFFMLKLKN